MARHPINPDIGEITCPFSGEVAPVRRDKNGKLYFVSAAGMIKPNNPAGQDWMLENAKIWGANHQKPAEQKPVTEPPKQEQQHAPVNENSAAKAALDLLNKQKKAANVPVNESATQKPVNVQSSPQQEKPAETQSLWKLLIG